MLRIFTDAVRNLIHSSGAILKTQRGDNHISSLSDSGDDLLGAGVHIGRGEYADAGIAIDRKIPNMTEHDNYVLDFVMPAIVIALLFVGNAIIVYVIFQYRKRKQPAFQGEEMALNSPPGQPLQLV